MPGKLKVRVLSGRDLPVMDRSSDSTDAFVEVRFGTTTFKTDVCRKSLNPSWNSEWFRFEVDDEDLQDEPLQIRVMDHDTYSAHDLIGTVYVDLNPLLTRDNAALISGWFPVYDTMHGIRGEIHLKVKVDLFSDFNKFRQSSCGVQFFYTCGVPQGYVLQAIRGFVEELVVNDDPEYQWIDKIRSPRTSNETRQRLFSKLSGELQRKIGLKVMEMGGNSVIGYKQCFDLEGESGIVVRAIGTAVTVSRFTTSSSPHSASPVRDVPVPEESAVTNSPSVTMATSATCTSGSKALSSSPSKSANILLRRLSDSDIGTPPKGSSIAGSGGSGSGGGGSGGGVATRPSQMRSLLQQGNHSIDIMEYPFFTMTSFPRGFIVHIGGVVSARSVKLLDRIHNPDEPETRDAWWTEIRTEIRSHARAVGCHSVVGYSEQTSICDEIIILSASGTAALVNLNCDPESAMRQNLLTLSLDRQQFEKEKEKVKVHEKLHVDVNLANQNASDRHRYLSEESEDDGMTYSCRLCHIPYNENSAPFPVNFSKCAICGKSKVPDVLFTTIEPPRELCVIGKGCLIQARICRVKKELKGETNAKEISDNLPFMEYELHKQLLSKLKIKGMNLLFGLKIQVTVGEELLVAIATATAVFAGPLPAPIAPKITGKGVDPNEDKRLERMQNNILDAVNSNRDLYGLHVPENNQGEPSPHSDYVIDETEEELSDLDLSSGNKDTFILEIDDAEDEAVVSVLLDPQIPSGFDTCNTQIVPGFPNLACNLQMFTRVWRGKLSDLNNKEFSALFEHVLRSIFFKLRTMVPCYVTNLDFNVELPEDDKIQVSVTAMCVGLGEPVNLLVGTQSSPDKANRQGDPDEMMFHMEGLGSCIDGSGTKPLPTVTTEGMPSQQSSFNSSKSAKSEKKIEYHMSPKHYDGIDLTPLPFIPGAHIEHYLGNINFFIIRESTSIRESGGLSGFVQSFITEVMAIARAHVAALGGNALVGYKMTECVLLDNPHKNQAQCLLNVCGDVVHVLYDRDRDQDDARTAVLVRQDSIMDSPNVREQIDINASS
ncbi:unnamed protein product [Owenia fusiformis]|uniref:Uncharacterized protein n=1 Tax=Owenia fusiformis TaxID=6347 RepID=A0A8J1Y2W3_OWEFU|nr:unnamed protein product [Owenia fusiformis]